MLYRNRFYHPTLGRFISRDPIGYEAGDGNLMRYVSNLPANLTDFMGLQWQVGAGMGIPPFVRPGGLFDPGNISTGYPQNYVDDPDNTDYCYSCRKNQANDCYPNHCYIQVGGLDKYGLPKEGTEGFGIAPGQKEGYSPNNREHAFRPITTIALCRDNNLVLMYGNGKGKKGGEATMDDIKNCLDSIPAKKDYRFPTYTCWTWASEAPGKCGLNFCGKKERHSWPTVPPGYELPVSPQRPDPSHRQIEPPKPKLNFWSPSPLFASKTSIN
jgi:hypothetical protein